jgi:hypothetical protein
MKARDLTAEEVAADLALENGRLLLEASRSQGWKLLFDDIRLQIEACRDQLCQDTDHERSVKLRGQLSAFRYVLALGNPAESKMAALEAAREDLRKQCDSRHNQRLLTRSPKP